MSTNSKSIGTAAETELVKAATRAGLKAARRALKGAGDDGDVHIALPNSTTLVVEVKAGDQTDNPSWGQIDKWWVEASVEASRVEFGIPVLVLKRPGSGKGGDWWAYISLFGLHRAGGLGNAIGFSDPGVTTDRVQLRVSDLFRLVSQDGVVNNLGEGIK